MFRAEENELSSLMKLFGYAPKVVSEQDDTI